MAEQTFFNIQLLFSLSLYQCVLYLRKLNGSSFLTFCIYMKIVMKANFLGLNTSLDANFETLTIFWPKYLWTIPLDSE